MKPQPAPPPRQRQPTESGFEHERIAAHLESAAAALEAPPSLRSHALRPRLRLRELGGEVRASTHEDAHVDLEALERSLTVLEEKLFAALTAAAPEELLVELKEHAARELAPYRSRMGAVQLRQVEHQFVQKQLLVHYSLAAPEPLLYESAMKRRQSNPRDENSSSRSVRKQPHRHRSW